MTEKIALKSSPAFFKKYEVTIQNMSHALKTHIFNSWKLMLSLCG
jgi:hypothetical protein